MVYPQIKQTVAALALLSATILNGQQAYATDLLERATFETTETTEVEFGSGWYIRGDIGGGLSPATTTANFESLSGSVELGTPITASVGLGFNLGENLRAETTFNQFSNLGVAGRETTFCGVSGGLAITGTCYKALSASPNISSLMANGYFDLGEFWGFTPYIGGGIGAAFVSWRDFTVKDVCIGDDSADCAPSGGVGENVTNTQTYDTEGDFSLAYNIMLGAGYRISQNVTLDAGYRFTSIGDVNLVNASKNSSVIDNFVSEGTDVHEFRIGLRYEIW